MLNRITDVIKQNTDEASATGNIKHLINPKVSRTKTKSTWVNFDQQATALNRDHKHILDFFLSELGCTGNLGSNNEMILVGGFQDKNFLKMIQNYIKDYVMCQNCKCLVTTLEKRDRLTYLVCSKCKASRTVQAITSRFVATKRGQRRKERM